MLLLRQIRVLATIQSFYWMTTKAVLVTLCTDHFCKEGCITADLNEYNCMPEGTPNDGYWSVRVENPDQDTEIYVSKHHFCSYYSGRKMRHRRQPQEAALLRVAAGDTSCHDVVTFGQNQGTTVIKSACIAHPNRLRPGDTTPPSDMEPISSAFQPWSSIRPHPLSQCFLTSIQMEHRVLGVKEPSFPSKTIKFLPDDSLSFDRPRPGDRVTPVSVRPTLPPSLSCTTTLYTHCQSFPKFYTIKIVSQLSGIDFNVSSTSNITSINSTLSSHKPWSRNISSPLEICPKCAENQSQLITTTIPYKNFLRSTSGANDRPSSGTEPNDNFATTEGLSIKFFSSKRLQEGLLTRQTNTQPIFSAYSLWRIPESSVNQSCPAKDQEEHYDRLSGFDMNDSFPKPSHFQIIRFQWTGYHEFLWRDQFNLINATIVEPL